MTKRLSFFVCAGSVCLALGLIPGCNAALGIEEAQLRADGAGASSATAGTVVHYAGDDICSSDNSACSACVATACKSTGGDNQCLGDHDCRGAMDDYNACLGKTCTAADCFDKLVAGPPKLADCFTSCVIPCSNVPVYSACQLYCACLGVNCARDFPAPYANNAACLADCLALPPELVTCRRTHCELAGLSGAPVHCDHAVGKGFCASATDLPMRDDSPTGCQKSLNSFACTTGSDCCSGNCDSRSSCAPP
ncbi:MAG TPA: hypothetical protein VNW92_06945 [Polyangiaceae bacterium]|nr:hypothetical protein [Polyangiaceae bacterium]